MARRETERRVADAVEGRRNLPPATGSGTDAGVGSPDRRVRRQARRRDGVPARNGIAVPGGAYA